MQNTICLRKDNPDVEKLFKAISIVSILEPKIGNTGKALYLESPFSCSRIMANYNGGIF